MSYSSFKIPRYSLSGSNGSLIRLSPSGLRKFLPPEDITTRPSLVRKPVEWSPERGEFVRELFSRLSPPYRHHLSSLTVEGFGSELLLFAISLDSYRECGYYMPVSEIIRLASLGPRGSKILKELRRRSFLFKIGGEPFSDTIVDPEVERLMPDSLDDIDEIFNYRYMILWEEHLSDFESYSFLPVKTSKEYITSFRESLSSLLKGVPKEREDKRIEILLTCSRSISLENSKSIRNFSRRQKNLSNDNFSLSIGKTKRSIIPVYPCGYRDTVVVEWKSLNTIRFIEDRTRRILKHLPYHCFTDNAEEFVRTVRRYNRYGKTFVCRDISKEGLTKPRYLLKIMLEELSKIDDSLAPFIDFFESFSVEGFEKIPTRGHGQGMANSLTTLMQISLCQMVNNLLAERGFSEVIDSLNYNDDNLTIVPNDILDDYWEIEGEIMEGLGIIRSDSKSFSSNKGFIFCEMYMSPFYPNLNDKNVTQRRIMLYSFLFEYPFEVKEYLKSISGNPFYSLYLEEIIETYGFEFFPEEIDLPLQLGGWRNDQILGYSTALVDTFDFDVRVQKAYQASKIKTSRFPIPKGILTKHRGEISIFDRIFSGYKDLRRYLPTGSFKDLFYSYRLERDNDRLNSLASRLTHKRRQKEYMKEVVIKTYHDFSLELISTGKFLIPDGYCKFTEPEQFFSEVHRNPYIQDTPIQNFLKKLGIEEEFDTPFEEEFSIKSTNFKFGLRKEEIFFWDPILERHQLGGIPFESEAFYSCDQKVEDTSSYLLAHYIALGKLPVPEGLLDEIPHKREVYKRFLTAEEFFEMSNVLYDRWSWHFMEQISTLIERSNVEINLDSILEEITISRLEEETSEDPPIEETPEEIELYLSLKQKFSRKKELDVDALVNILLCQRSASGYRHQDILEDLLYPVSKFYGRRDGDTAESRKLFILPHFERFLNVPELKELLVSCCQEGYLVELGEALEIFSPESDLEDFGLGSLE